MKRPYRLGKVLVDLEEVAVVEDWHTMDSCMHVGFALVMRSGYKVYAKDTNHDDGKLKLKKLREQIINLLDNNDEKN
jgi:hypothetical protein